MPSGAVSPVTAINAGRFYGDSNPDFTGTVSGLAAGDNITVTFTCVANPGSSVGDYVIVPTLVDPDNKLGNYNVVINNGTLTVTPAPLSIVADDVTRAVGQPNPARAADQREQDALRQQSAYQAPAGSAE